MKRVYVNEQWCLGCHLCEYYCAFANSGKSDMVKALKGAAVHPNIRIEEGPGGISFAVACRHCSEPLCVRGCISGALQVRDGVVTIDESKCVGCYTCVASCPMALSCPARTAQYRSASCAPKAAVYPPAWSTVQTRPSSLRRGGPGHEVRHHRRQRSSIGCIEGVRSVDKTGEIILITGETEWNYSRPLISYLLEARPRGTKCGAGRTAFLPGTV